MFAFTVETHDNPGVRLQGTLRYAHGSAHIRAAIAAAGLELKQLAEMTGAYAHFPTDPDKCREVMDKIAQSDSIHPGDMVITSGLGGELPKGLVIGRVESVSTRDNAVFQTAQIASDLHFNKLELVFVVLGEQQ